MGRLIDADELINGIEEWRSALICTQYADAIIDGTLSMIENTINQMPTAYSVEAVVRELEEQRNGEFTDEYTKFCFGKAIEIVKRGGRNE